MKKSLTHLITLFALSGIFILQPLSAQVLDRIVAVVEEEPILMSELQQKLQLQIQQNGLQITNEQQALALQNEVLESIIADKILLIKAQRDSLTFDPIKRDELVRERFSRIKEMSGSDEDFKKSLEAEGMNEREFKRTLSDDIGNYLLKEMVMMQVAGGMQVTSQEIETFFAQHKNSLPAQPESVNIAHIILPLLPDTAATMQKIHTIIAELKAGKDFHEAAIEYSDGPSGKTGGRLNWFNKGDMVPAFDKAVFAMQPEQISDPILTQFGYHIIKLHQKEETRVNASHILITLQADNTAAEKLQAHLTTIKAEITQGLAFSDAAKKYSADTTTSSTGGDLGWQALQRLPKEFIAPINLLQPGQVSAPVASPLGFHLFMLKERHAAGTISLESNYDMIKNMARNQKIMGELEKVVTAMKETVYIENRLQQK